MRNPFFQQVILISFICVGTANCTSLEKPPTEGLTTKQKMDRVMTEMTQLIGDASCTDNKQCASLAIGAKPCGGPRSYRVYSTVNTDAQKLTELSQQFKSLNKQYNRESGLMSDCMMVMPPPVACINNTCQVTQTQ